MRRITAIEKIRKWFLTDFDYYNTNSYDSAKKLLVFIEKEIGMLPPIDKSSRSKKSTIKISKPKWDKELKKYKEL